MLAATVVIMTSIMFFEPAFAKRYGARVEDWYVSFDNPYGFTIGIFFIIALIFFVADDVKKWWNDQGRWWLRKRK